MRKLIFIALIISVVYLLTLSIIFDPNISDRVYNLLSFVLGYLVKVLIDYGSMRKDADDEIKSDNNNEH